MNFLTLFIRKPVLAMMVNLSLIVLGLFAYTQLGVDIMPKVDFPVVFVATNLEGAGPEEIESQITKPIEDAVAVIGDIQMISSTSQEGTSMVTIMFQLDKNIDVAVQEVRDKVNLIQNQFPEGTKMPIIQKADPSATPVMVLAVYGDLDPKVMTDIIQHQVKDDIESVNGVGQVNVLGGQTREIQIILDADKLNSYGITISQVKQAIASQNTEVPGGRVTSGYNEYILRTSGRLKTVDEFNDIIVKDVQGTAIKIKDIGRAIDGIKEQRSLSRLNGKPTLTLQIVKTSDANTVKVVENVKTRLAAIQQVLPKGMHIEIVKDSSIYINKSVHDILEHLIVGGSLACLVVFLFMGNLRSTIIAACAIPTSIISSFIIMKFMHFTLNMITLLALALVVGIVIDDAIVVLENIWRMIEEKGMAPMEAAIEGTQEIGFAVIATTISLIIIFLPIAFMSGIVGRYFVSYGITMAFSIFMSMVVSFTLTPMLCSRLLKPPDRTKEKKEPSYLTRLLQDSYGSVLNFSLRHRWLIIVICFLTILLGVFMYGQLGQEFSTAEDQGDYTISVKLPKSWPVERSSKELQRLEKDISSLKYVRYVLTTIGTGDDATISSDVSQASIYVRLEDFKDRQGYTQFVSMREARKILKKYDLLKTSVQQASSTGGTSGADLQFSIQGDDLDVLNDASNKIMNELKKRKGFVDIDTNLVMASPEVQVNVDREKAAAINVNIQDVSSTLRTMIGGEKVSNYQEDKWMYDVTLRLRDEDRNTPEAMKRLYVPTIDGKLTPLIGIAAINEGTGPSTIFRMDRQRQVTIETNLQDLPQVKAMTIAQNVVSGLNLPKGYSIAFQGNSMFIAETFAAFIMAFILAVIFMYMVLASQFEDYLDPMIILLTLPLAVPFAILSLYVANMTLNIFSALGMFLLFGIVKKNAILQIDHTKNLMREGVPTRQAIIQANRDRIRPIIMTTVTLVVGMLPVALAGPEGATRAPMAVVVIGGQSLCLLLTLLVVPVVFSYVHEDLEGMKIGKVLKKFENIFKKKKEEEKPAAPLKETRGDFLRESDFPEAVKPGPMPEKDKLPPKTKHPETGGKDIDAGQ